MRKILSFILPIFIILLVTQSCSYQTYSPHPIHTRITSDHYRKLEQSIIKREQIQRKQQQKEAARYRDNDAHYYLRGYNQNADNQPYYGQIYSSPIVVQPPVQGNSPATTSKPTPPSSQNKTSRAPVPTDNDSTYYLRQPNTAQDNPTVISPRASNRAPTIIVVPPPQVAAPQLQATPPYPVDNDADYYMDYNRPTISPSPNRAPPADINRDLELFFNDS